MRDCGRSTSQFGHCAAKAMGYRTGNVCLAAKRPSAHATHRRRSAHSECLPNARQNDGRDVWRLLRIASRECYRLRYLRSDAARAYLRGSSMCAAPQHRRSSRTSGHQNSLLLYCGKRAIEKTALVDVDQTAAATATTTTHSRAVWDDGTSESRANQVEERS